ncbi:MAG: maleylpyruvate isomerase family mycothiol-dependent enzyme [Propionibacteriaceae bacterium]|nr:maleylpyruvate isomerase family mycothiol-dependent enzyme [Propionibacteriaceae bacterium]
MLDHLSALQRYQQEFLATIPLARPDAHVRFCGDWTVADLIEHLAGIHHWAAGKARGVPESPLEFESTDPAERYAHYAAELRDALAELDPDAPAWTLSDQGLPPERHTGTVRFWHRRQALETLVHLWDLRTAAGLDFDPGAEAWLDCLDEVVAVMHPRQLRLGRIGPPAVRVRFRPRETERVWELTGADATAPVVALYGPAAALALLAWGRATPDDPAITVEGDRVLLDGVLAAGLTP